MSGLSAIWHPVFFNKRGDTREMQSLNCTFELGK